MGADIVADLFGWILAFIAGVLTGKYGIPVLVDAVRGPRAR